MSKQCWDCNIELTRVGTNKLQCTKCQYIYFDCERCEDGIDPIHNDKGMFCERCDHHYCILCWQHTGTLKEDYTWNCDSCRFRTSKSCYNCDVELIRVSTKELQCMECKNIYFD